MAAIGRGLVPNVVAKPDEATFGRFEQAAAGLLRLAPNAAPAWLAVGDWYLRAALQPGRSVQAAPDLLEKGVGAFRRAVSLYPNSAAYRAKLAEAYHVAGDRAAFRPRGKGRA